MSRRVVALILLLVATLLTPPQPARAVTTLFVDDEIDCDDSDGVPYYCHIQDAVDDAVDGDTIQVAAGTYTEPSGSWTVDIGSTDLTIDGAGEGVTIISGLDARGGIKSNGGNLSILDLTITDAFSGSSGASVLYEAASVLAMTDVTIQNGSTVASSGGLYLNSGGTATLLRVTATGNTASNATFGTGGALDAIGSFSMTITDSVFSNNSAGNRGGAIHIGSGPDLTVVHTSFVDNSSTGDGGAIYLAGATSALIIQDSTFHSNETAATAPNGGGAIYFNGESLTLTGSTFTENHSGRHGGAILDTTNQKATIANSTFSGNSADELGGAIASSGDVTNVTVTGNTADSGGGFADSGFQNAEVGNSIIYGNTATGLGAGQDCSGPFISAGYNLFATTANCTMSGDTASNVEGEDPGLGLLADNGGPTFTMAIDSTSPAYNTANPAIPGSGGAACAGADQRGRPRGDARCDIGAFELSTVLRYAGANRYDTAATVSEEDFSDPAFVDTVFVATGSNFPDGLAGAAIAAKLGAPLLLVDSAGVPTETAAELTRLTPDDIVILGGASVIPDAVKDTLEAYATNPVTRVAGGTRYETAVEISQYGFPVDGSADVVFIATGTNFPDALAAGAAAAHMNGPVLLVPASGLPAEVAAEILRLTPDSIVIVGGSGAVPDATLTALDALQGGDVVTRISGADRYATSVAISAFAFGAGAARAYIATGFNFPDALAGAAAAGWWDSPVLLVPGTSLPAAVSTEITDLGASTAIILGGTAVVGQAVEDDLNTLLGS